MSGCQGFLKKLVRRKAFSGEDIQSTDLRRCLSTLDLIGLGVGSTLGSGVYILTGQVAKETAGPAVIVSFLIAGVASAFAGLCYAEFAARVPRAGSAYVYSYVTVGELMAFVIGWNLLLEYIIGTASVARAWSAYFDSLVDKKIETFFRDNMPMNVTGLSAYPDFFAFGITLLVTGLLALGVKESIRFNNVFTCVNLLVIAYVVICGFFKADVHNWALSGSELPESGVAGSGGFLPFGFSGLMAGAATCFYAYIGFDCIATTGEETTNPQKSIPVGILAALLIVTVAYCSVGAIVTLLCPYFLLDADAPLPFLFDRLHWGVAKYFITAGALCGLSTSLLGAMFPLPRVLYAMGSDGLLFRFLATVNARFHTPLVGTFISGLLAGVMAMLFDLAELVDMMSIGTLLAYTLVAVCVLLLRYETEDKLPKLTSNQPGFNPLSLARLERDRDAFSCFQLVRPSSEYPTALSSSIVKYSVGIMCVFIAAFCAVSIWMASQLTEGKWFAIVALIIPGLLAVLCLIIIRCQPENTTPLMFKVPMVPYTPALSCLVNIYLMLKLNSMTWVRFGVWMVVGMAIYFFYGVWQSSTQDHEQEQDNLLTPASGDQGSYSSLLHVGPPKSTSNSTHQASKKKTGPAVSSSLSSSSADDLDESAH